MYEGDDDTITIIANTTGDGPVTNTANINSSAFDPNPQNNSASVEITIGVSGGGIFSDSFEEPEQ
jgi:hypothetical protein